MNILYLDECPVRAAQYQHNKHVIKMTLESAQLLSTAHVVLDGIQVGYRSTHRNHPSAVWVRKSVYNCNWLYDHMIALGCEYSNRFNRVHKTITFLAVTLQDPPHNIPTLPFVPPPKCMPDQYKQGTTVEAYRRYYQKEKIWDAKWGKRGAPDWAEA